MTTITDIILEDQTDRFGSETRQSHFHPQKAKIVNGILLGLFAVIIVNLIIKNMRNEVMTEEQKREKKMLMQQTIEMAGLVLWPFLWSKIIGYSTLVSKPGSIISFVWPIILLLIELYNTHHTAVSDKRKLYSLGFGNVKADTAALITIALAICAVLGNHLSKPDSLVKSVPLLMGALWLCVAFVIVTPGFKDDKVSGVAISTIQRTAFIYALGLICTAISLSW